MKSNRILAICILLISVGFLNAQTTIYDANRWMGSDLNGTARFVGMGGAMGALGGDITTMGTNPAGIGIYRSNYNRQIKKFPTEKQNVSLKHILT